jgi:hypothetical protein
MNDERNGDMELDSACQEKICRVVAMGASRRTAARQAGCSVDAIRRAANQDAAFHGRLKLAESKPEAIHIENIETASKKCWRASAWVLERLYPERYARRGPGTVTAEQVSHLLKQYAEVIVSEVPDTLVCDKILQRVDTLVKNSQPLNHGE